VAVCGRLQRRLWLVIPRGVDGGQGGVGGPVRLGAALCLADVTTQWPPGTMNVFVEALQNPEETNTMFTSDEASMEQKHHPIGQAMLGCEGRLDEMDDERDVGRDEDMKFPWQDRWISGWNTFRILGLLAKSEFHDIDRVMPALLPYLDKANEYTCDSVVIPIVRFVFGDLKLTPETRRAELSAAQLEVLRRLYDNVQIWATNHCHDTFDTVGLGERRADWARLLKIDNEFTDAEIQEMLNRLIPEKQRSGQVPLREFRLCRIATPGCLPHLKPYSADLEILDFAGTDLGDPEMLELAEYSNLKILRLNAVPITDTGVAHLTAITTLEELYLYQTRVTDGVFASLECLPKLKYVHLGKTAVTGEGAQQFRDAHPNCRVNR
jgi:hypothetical protein